MPNPAHNTIQQQLQADIEHARMVKRFDDAGYVRIYDEVIIPSATEHDQTTIGRVAREVAGALGDEVFHDESVCFEFDDRGTMLSTYDFTSYLRDHRTAARVFVHVLDSQRWSSGEQGKIRGLWMNAMRNPLGSIIELWRVVGEES